MVAIQKIGVSSQYKYNRPQSIQQFSNNVVSINANDKLLENFLELVGNQNRSLVSFGKAPIRHGKQEQEFVPVIPMQQGYVRPYGMNFDVTAFSPTLSDYSKYKIQNQSISRINAERPWPKIEDIEAWMVTAETDEFKSDGGLGKVAADLPNSFNKRFKKDEKNYMSVITPMYVNGKEYRLEKKGNDFFYTYKKQGKAEIKVEYQGTINVPIYDPSQNTKLKDIDVRIFTGELQTNKDKKPTKHIFLEIPEDGNDSNNNFTRFNQIFNINDYDPKATNNNTPYANTPFADPVFRMAFFSKSVYELIKSIKEGDFKGIKAPNCVLLNDWHAGSLAAMFNYTAQAEADTGAISKETGEYFDKLPTIYIVHNCEHQGATDGNDMNRTNIFGTLFGAYGMDIIGNSKSWNEAFDEDKSSLMRYTNFNSAKTGLSLADRVVPVSDYYMEELVKSNEKARGLMHLMKARHYGPGHTLIPITNGYSKALIEPTQSHMDEVWNKSKGDLTLADPSAPKINFDNLSLKAYDEKTLQNKIDNKNAIMNVFKQIIEREKQLPYDESDNRKYMIFEADRTDLKEDDFSNTPVIAYSGRIDPQKGVDSIFKEAMWKFAEHNKNTPEEKLPVFIIGGTISQKGSYDKLKEFKHYMTEFYPNVGKRIILIKGFLRTDFVATASDMFLVPSAFEPCGLTQLEAMAKGSLPVATSTGGLVTTIKDNIDGFRTKAFFDETGDKQLLYGSGYGNNYDAYCETLERALDTYYNHRDKFEEMQKTALNNDFSWDKEGGAIDKYINLIRTGRIN